MKRLANASHNGKKGTIIKTKKSPGEGRVAVRLDDGKTVLLVKLENLEEEWPALPSPSKHSFCALNDCFDDSNADPEEEEAISELVQDESQGENQVVSFWAWSLERGGELEEVDAKSRKLPSSNIAVKEQVFGVEGAERIVRKVRFCDSKRNHIGMAMVAKESRFVGKCSAVVASHQSFQIACICVHTGTKDFFLLLLSTIFNNLSMRTWFQAMMLHLIKWIIMKSL